MHRYDVFVSNAAKDDLLAIKRYISVQLKNTASSERIIELIEKKVLSLKLFPEVSPFTIKGKKLFSARVQNYRIIYTVDKDSKSVNIVRVLYSRRNIEDLIAK